MQKTITKRAVDALKLGQIIADDQLPGFVCRRLPSGRLTFGYRFTKDGRRRWLAIGVGITPEAARKAAARHAGSVAKDENPMTDREHRRRRAHSARTLDQRLDAWIKERVDGRGLRSAAEIKSLLDRYVRPRLGHRMVETVKRLDMVELLDRVAAEASPRTSDKVLSIMGTFFRWLALRDDEFRSPIVPGMARLTLKDLSRDRVLADDEIRSLWTALESCQPAAYARILRALLLSACRLNEIARLSRPEIDGDLAVIPAERVKTKVEHVLPITPALADLIGTQGDAAGDYVFSTDGGFSPFSGFSKAKRRLDGIIAAQRKKAGLRPMAPWRLHDLRRTARSFMSRAGVSADVAERVLGHALPGVRGVYDRHEYLAEKRDALERLAALLASIIMTNGQSSRVVIPANLRPLLNHNPKALSRLESGSALADVWDLLEGQQNREALFYDLLVCALAAHTHARTWHKPWKDMTRAERAEYRSPQGTACTSSSEILRTLGDAIDKATALRAATADPELAAALDATIKATTAGAEPLGARDRADAELVSRAISYFQANPHKKTIAAWRIWFGCVLCRWFVLNLKRPHRAQAAALAERFFHDCPGHVRPEQLSRNRRRSA